jgi:hypothetical protein
MSTHAWGNCFVCDHQWQYDDLHCSFCCCLSKSKNRSKSKKGTLTKSHTIFWTKCLRSKRRNDHCAWPLPSFWSDHICDHLFSWIDISWSPSCCNVVDCCVDHCGGNRCVGVCCNHLDCMVIVMVLMTMVLVVQTMTASDRRMSCFLILWLFLFLELVKDTGRFVSSLALLKKGYKPKRVCGHCFVCLRKVKLMRLWLRKKHFFCFLLRRGQLHCSTEESAIKVAEELHSMPHEFMHQHECTLLCNTKPTNQLVTNVWEPGNCLEVIPDALVEVFLCQVGIVGELLAHNIGLLSETNVLKTLAYQAEQCWAVFLLGLRKMGGNLWQTQINTWVQIVLGQARRVRCVPFALFHKEPWCNPSPFNNFFSNIGLLPLTTFAGKTLWMPVITTVVTCSNCSLKVEMTFAHEVVNVHFKSIQRGIVWSRCGREHVKRHVPCNMMHKFLRGRLPVGVLQ